MKPERNRTLADALANLSTDSGASDDYCKGLTLGVVSTLMAAGQSFEKAIAIVRVNLPTRYYRGHARSFPDAFLAELVQQDEKEQS